MKVNILGTKIFRDFRDFRDFLKNGNIRPSFYTKKLLICNNLLEVDSRHTYKENKGEIFHFVKRGVATSSSPNGIFLEIAYFGLPGLHEIGSIDCDLHVIVCSTRCREYT